jgi:hypothetical protein
MVHATCSSDDGDNDAPIAAFVVVDVDVTDGVKIVVDVAVGLSTDFISFLSCTTVVVNVTPGAAIGAAGIAPPTLLIIPIEAGDDNSTQHHDQRPLD